MSKTYTVSVSNNFDAESPEDAVSQMVTWLVDSAPVAGYRVDVDWETNTRFIDAEELDLR